MIIPNSKSVPVEYIQQCFEYREEVVDGVLQGNVYWKYREDVPEQWNARFAGKKAGFTNSTGYYTVEVQYNYQRCVMKLHNVIWILHKNRYPHNNMVIDHIDRDKKNNLMDNLRELNSYQNSLNKSPSKNGSSKYKGVRRNRNAWQTIISKNGSSVFTKYVKDELEAALIYNQEIDKHHDSKYVYHNDISNGYTNNKYPNMPRGWKPEKVAA
jgi:hypothetical protein